MRMKKRLVETSLVICLVLIVGINVDAKQRTQESLDANAVEEPKSPISIEINIPAFRLDLYQGKEIKKSYLVGVGMPYYPTVRRHFKMHNIQWNPWWYAPSSDWAKGAGGSRPGPKNPLGPVKMILAGTSYLIHGTNKPESIGHTSSHGCIRMFSEDATELAWTIMVMVGTVNPMRTPEEYASMDGSPLVTLKQDVPVRTVYRRVEVRDSRLMIHPDPYSRQHLSLDKVQGVLAGQGYPIESVSTKDIELMLNISQHGTIYKTINIEAKNEANNIEAQ